MGNDDFNVLPLSEGAICDMYEKMETVDLFYCFPSLLRSVAKNDDDDGELYVSIVVFDAGNPVRFILREGKRMKPSIEQQFIKYVHSSSLVVGDEQKYKAFTRLINLAYRNRLHVTVGLKLGIVLEYIYYQLCVSDYELKTMLYGEGLNYIAFNIERVASLDANANTISDIVNGKQLSHDQLRLLNQKDMVKYLFSEESLETFLYKYKTISSSFIDLSCAKVNRLQFEYLFNTASKISSKKDVIKVFDFNQYDFLGHLPDLPDECESYLNE